MMKKLFFIALLGLLLSNIAMAQDIPKDTIQRFTPSNLPEGFIEPEFIGGKEAFCKYINDNLITKGVGKMIVQFVVEKDGSLSNIQIIESVDKKTDKRMIKLLKKSPIWTPGYVHEKPVRAMYTLPVTLKKTQVN